MMNHRTKLGVKTLQFRLDCDLVCHVKLRFQLALESIRVIVYPACLLTYTPANTWSKPSTLPGGEIWTQKIKSCLLRVG